MENRRTPGQRAGLSRDQVLAGARALLAEGGADALTMRALAARLGVRPNALYSHVADKDELLEALVDDALAAVPDPAPDVDWRTGLRDLMAASHRALLGSPQLVPLTLGRGSRGPHARRLGEGVTALLARGGVTGAPAREALRVLVVYTIGFAAFEVRPGFTDADPAQRRADLDRTYERGLDWLLAGIAG
ncbi:MULTISPECIES: TetR/AcrR family transcriptional regulator [unclassified Blastococcus]